MNLDTGTVKIDTFTLTLDHRCIDMNLYLYINIIFFYLVYKKYFKIFICYYHFKII